MPRPPRRPLVLHVSALSDAEYSTYTESLAEVTTPVPDVDWEDLAMGVREARGWIKGRYGVDGSVIDQILRLFCPELAPQDTLTGGQFFAALRLVSHAQHGASVDESLVFVQANPERPPSPGKLTRTPPTKSAPPPPPPRLSPETPITPSLPPRTAPAVPSPNPFTRTNSNPPRARPRPDSQPPLGRIEKPAPEPPVSSNPFLRAQSNPHPPPPSSTSSSSSSPRQYATPPLPPRKAPSLLPPPRHASLSNPSANSPFLPPPIPAPPLKPPKPPQATSALIKQSLQAAKGEQSRKEAMEGLKRARKLEVIKKSGTSGTGTEEQHANGGGSGSGSGSGGSRNGTAVRAPSPPESFYDVAAARIGRASPSVSSVSSADLPQHLPRTDSPAPHLTLDPGTPSSPGSPGSPSVPNPRRTRSLHHPRTSSGPLPPTPPPRRRPESVQVASLSQSPSHPSSPSHPFSPSHPYSPSRANGNGTPLSRHLSFSDTSSGVIDTLHRAIGGLRPGPGFESARVRAEGRVWPGGYVKGLKGDGERLVGRDEDDGFGQDAGGDEVKIGEGWRPLG